MPADNALAVGQQQVLRLLATALEGARDQDDFLTRAADALAELFDARRTAIFVSQPELAARPFVRGWSASEANATREQVSRAPAWPAVTLSGRTLASPWGTSTTQLGVLLLARAPEQPPFGPEDAARLDVAGLALALGWSQARHHDQTSVAAEKEAARLREMVRRSADLEAMKTRLLNLAAHELRGPLTVLRGYISMLADGSLDSTGLRRITPILLGKAAQMDALVNQMLDAARLEAGELDAYIEQVDLGAVTREAVEVASLLCPPGMSVFLERPPGPAVVDGDRQRLASIVGNLIDNAIKYSPEGGEVRCLLVSTDDRVVFSVIDEGLGIAAEHRPILFTRFGRIVTPENSHIAGMGLGLYLSREAARRQGGDIEVDSELGRGSRFTLWLPRAAARP